MVVKTRDPNNFFSLFKGFLKHCQSRVGTGMASFMAYVVVGAAPVPGRGVRCVVLTACYTTPHDVPDSGRCILRGLPGQESTTRSPIPGSSLDLRPMFRSWVPRGGVATHHEVDFPVMIKLLRVGQDL
jgi:hypothetical protein